MEANQDNHDFDEILSPLENVLENHPNFIWGDDKKKAA